MVEIVKLKPKTTARKDWTSKATTVIGNNKFEVELTFQNPDIIRMRNQQKLQCFILELERLKFRLISVNSKRSNKAYQ